MTINLPAILAEEKLRDHGGDLQPDELYRVTLLATGDEKVARMAQRQRYKAIRDAQFLAGK